MAPLLALLALLAWCPAATAADGGSVDQFRDLWPAISRCWTPPDNSAGMEMTVRFSLKRTGELVGDPRVTYSRLVGNRDQQEHFRDSVLAAVRACTPLPLSDRMGATIAGQPLSVRFIGRSGAPRTPVTPTIRA